MASPRKNELFYAISRSYFVTVATISTLKASNMMGHRDELVESSIAGNLYCEQLLAETAPYVNGYSVFHRSIYVQWRKK
jgi:hypothetical protein